GEGANRRGGRGAQAAGRLAQRRLARTPNMGHVRRRVRRPPGSPPPADAGGLGRAPGTQGLSGADPKGRTDLRAARGQRGGIQGEHRTRSGETSPLGIGGAQNKTRPTARPKRRPYIRTNDEHMAELRTETMTVNMGPQHPSTHGVLRLVLELDGEIIKSAMPTIGYLHTGIEKTAEQKKWQQVIPLVERMDYLGAQSNSLAYVLSVEKLLGLEMPQRVKDIRVLIAELQRMASHLVWIGTHAMEIGAVSMLFYAILERELLMNINELVAGFRFFPSYFRVGGLRED